jgi:hypothetical protein
MRSQRGPSTATHPTVPIGRGVHGGRGGARRRYTRLREEALQLQALHPAPPVDVGTQVREHACCPAVQRRRRERTWGAGCVCAAATRLHVLPKSNPAPPGDGCCHLRSGHAGVVTPSARLACKAHAGARSVSPSPASSPPARELSRSLSHMCFSRQETHALKRARTPRQGAELPAGMARGGGAALAAGGRPPLQPGAQYHLPHIHNYHDQNSGLTEIYYVLRYRYGYSCDGATGTTTSRCWPSPRAVSSGCCSREAPHGGGCCRPQCASPSQAWCVSGCMWPVVPCGHHGHHESSPSSPSSSEHSRSLATG